MAKKAAAMKSRTTTARKAERVPYAVGERLYIQTATYHFVGDVVYVGESELVVEPAVWVADSGRLNAALTQGFAAQSNSELEPIPGPLTLNRSGIIAAMRYGFPMPTGVK